MEPDREIIYGYKFFVPESVLDSNKYFECFSNYLKSFYDSVQPVFPKDKTEKYFFVLSRGGKVLEELREDVVKRDLVQKVEADVFAEMLSTNKDALDYLTKTL